MRLYLICTLLLMSLSAYTQSLTELNEIKKSINLKEGETYLFCRGTKQKSGFIARRFNTIDTNMTHVGLGFMEKGSLRIYHVVDDPSGNSALRVDSLESFISCGGAYYFSAWACQTNLRENEKIKAACDLITARKIFFDASFRIRNDDTLYCSEFCAGILQKAVPDKFKFKPRKLVLNNSLYESYLQRKELIYFPVDFFQQLRLIKKVFEYRLDQ